MFLLTFNPLRLGDEQDSRGVIAYPTAFPNTDPASPANEIPANRIILRRRPSARRANVEEVRTKGARITRTGAAGTLAFCLATLTSCGHPAHPPPVAGAPATSSASLPATTTDTVVPEGDFTTVAQLVNDAIAEPRMPGAVVQIGRGGKIVFRQAFGVRKLPG